MQKQQTVISVAWSNGRWQVTESGPRNAISCFAERQDAMDYAMALAGGAGNAGGIGGGRDDSPRARWPRRQRPDAIFRS
jgi:hypothetical protein